MDFIRRGFAGVIRKPTKTVILLGIVFVLGNMIAGAISIQQAVRNTEANLYNKMSPITTISVDWEQYAVYTEKNSGPVTLSLPLDKLQKIGESPHIKYYDYSYSINLVSALNRYEGGREDYSESSMRSFSFKGVGNPDMLDIKEGQIKIVAGRAFNEEELQNLTYVVLISDTVARENNLGVGATVIFDNEIDIPISYTVDEAGYVPYVTKSQNYEFEVIGIYETSRQYRQLEDSARWDPQGRDIDLENVMYVSNRVVVEANNFLRDAARQGASERVSHYPPPEYTVLYVLNDPKGLEAFKDDVAALVPDYYKVVASGSFDAVAVPMKSIGDIASMILYVTVGAALVILSLLITLFLRDRKHEIGIYLSLGERKTKVAAQVVLEVVVIAVVAITLSLFSGNALSGALSEKMLIDEVAAEQARASEQKQIYSDLDWMGYSDNLNSEEIIESYTVSIDWRTVFLFYLIGLGVVCISTLIPIVYTTRLNPKKILM